MVNGTLGAAVRRTLLGLYGPNAPTDGQLLERFIRQHDAALFEAVVQRHGGMVLRVCQRVLANPADAEDAFQATFIVLLRKAETLARYPSVGAWLHQVAFRIASAAPQVLWRLPGPVQPGLTHGSVSVSLPEEKPTMAGPVWLVAGAVGAVIWHLTCRTEVKRPSLPKSDNNRVRQTDRWGHQK